MRRRLRAWAWLRCNLTDTLSGTYRVNGTTVSTTESINSHIGSDYAYCVSGNTLTLNDTGGAGTDSLVLTRAKTAP